MNSSLLRSRLHRVLIGLAVAAAFLLLRGALEPLLDGRAPLALALTGCLLAAWRFGPIEGLAAALSGIAGSYVFFVRPAERLYGSAVDETIGIGSSLLIAGCGVLMSRSRQLSLREADEAEAERKLVSERLQGEAAEREVLKESALALRLEAEERRRLFDRVLGRVSDLIILYDADGRVADLNPAAERFLGMPAGELRGRSITEVIPLAAEIEAWMLKVQREGRHERIEYASKRGKGEYEVDAFPGPDGMVVVSRDVTAVREARRAADYWKVTYERATDTLDGFVYRYDLESGRVERSAGFQRLLGYGPEVATGEAGWWASIVHPDDMGPLIPIIDAIHRGEHIPYATEYRVRTADGQFKWVWDRARPYTDSEGTVYVGQTTDITPERELRDRLAAAGEDATFLAEFSERCRATTNESVVADACNAIRDRYGVDRAAFYRLDWNAEVLLTLGQSEGADPVPDRLPFSALPGSLPALFEGTTVRGSADSHTASDEERELLRRHGIRTFLAHPVRRDGRTAAILGLQTPEDRTWTERDLGLLATLADRLFDAAERAHAERARRETEAFFADVLRIAPQLVWTARGDGMVTWVNENWESYFGRKLDEALASGWDGMIHPEDEPAILGAWGTAAGGANSFEFEYRIRRHDGQFRWHLCRAATVEARGDRHWFGTLTDIHDLKSARAELDRSEREGRAALESLPGPVWLLGADGSLDYVNPAFVRTTGLNRPREWQEAISRADRSRIDREWHQHLIQGSPFREECRLVTAGNGARWHEVTVTPFVGPEGVTRWFGTAVDVDDTKTEARRLEVLVGQRTKELVESNKDLEAFCYSVSHDLRAPLRAIVSASRIIVEDHGETLPGDVRSELDRQAAAAKRMGELIDDLLELSRIGRSELAPETVDVGALARHCWLELRGEPERLVIEEPVDVVADYRQLRVLLQNILDNAMKYADPGRGPQVTIRRTGDEIEIRDRGIGFDMTYAKKIFEPFHRLEHGSEVEGTGIGLSNVRRVIERHHGTYRVESTPGVGTAFFFRLAPPGSA